MGRQKIKTDSVNSFLVTVRATCVTCGKVRSYVGQGSNFDYLVKAAREHLKAGREDRNYTCPNCIEKTEDVKDEVK